MTAELTEYKLIDDSAQSIVDVGKEKEEVLSELFSSALNVDSGSSRLSQYKCRLRDETNQETRRRLLLQQQKDKRNAKFNERRLVGVKKDDEASGGHWFDNEIFTVDEDVDDNMEWSSIKKVSWHKHGKIFRDVLMYSEWLLDIPSDVSEKWIMVPCPVGKRNLVVSNQRGTRSFSKKGVTMCNFGSLLPNKTILDCIWSFKMKSFYVIDVIQWNGMTLKDCQSDFRFYWLDSKFQENPDYSLKSNSNDYPMIKLSRCICNLNEMIELIHDYHQNQLHFPKLDGLLFYHSETHYTSGNTPLVGWLKPFMLADAFGVSLSSDYGYKKPDEYTNYKEFIENYEKRKEYRDNKKLSRKNKMDCDEGSTDSELMNQCCDSNFLDDESFSVDYCT